MKKGIFKGFFEQFSLLRIKNRILKKNKKEKKYISELERAIAVRDDKNLNSLQPYIKFSTLLLFKISLMKYNMQNFFNLKSRAKLTEKQIINFYRIHFHNEKLEGVFLYDVFPFLANSEKYSKSHEKPLKSIKKIGYIIY